MSKIVGYGGILVPNRNQFQGFFIKDSYQEDAEKFIRDARRMAELQSSPISHTIEKSPGVADEDQAVFGLCASVTLDRFLEDDPARVAVASYAVYLLSKAPYYLLTANPQGDEYSVIFQPMPFLITSPDAAREYLNNLPEVKEITLRLVADKYQRGKTRH